MNIKGKFEICYCFAGGRPSCEDTVSHIIAGANESRVNGTLENCVANDVPGTFSYFGVCSSISCLPVDFCESTDW